LKVVGRLLLAFLIIFSAVGPYLVGKTVQAETVNTPMSLGFTPHDTAIDPNQPVVYMTKLGSKTLYAVNFSTGAIKTLTLPYPAERLDIRNNKLYVTQHKMSHDYYNFGPYSGAIAEINTDTFTVSHVLDINADPFDIAVDDKGYIYISPGSGQHGKLTVYSMTEKKEITQNSASTTLYARSNIYFNAETSKIYANDTTGSPLDIEAYEVVNGVIQNNYDSPYHGDYAIGIAGKISPDGSYMYNNGGYVFNLATYRSGDMTFHTSFGKKYNDYEFSEQLQLTFAASATTGIDVYQNGTNTFLYSLRKDLAVQKLHIQNGVLVAISKNSDGSYFLETFSAASQPTSGLPENPGIPDPVGTLKNLGFKPNDAVIDPNLPIIYMTKLGSKTIYAANFVSGEIKALALPYPAERLELYNDRLYVTQHKMAHEYYTTKPLVGAIAEVDTKSFTATKIIDVDTDPYDIAIDENGYIYIAPGSNQWVNMKIYSLATGGEVPAGYSANMRAWSYLYYNTETSKVYSIDTDTSPRDVDAYEVSNGTIKAHYDSPYHGDYPLEPFAKITPDGYTMYNNSGVVFDLAMYRSGDLTYTFTLGKKYNDYEFSLQQELTFAARTDGGIDVYQYNTRNYLYTIRTDLTVEKLYYQDGQIIAIGIDSNGRYFIEGIDENTEGIPEDPSTPTDPEEPGTPTDPEDPVTPEEPISIEFIDAISLWWDWDGEYYYEELFNGVKDVSLDSIFVLGFDNLVEVMDETLITLKGPEGNVELYSGAEEDTLTIVPYLLNGSTTYTLTVKKEAISNLANDVVIQFTTASNWEYYDGIWYYYDPSIGDYVTGWKDVAGVRYYFNENGEMQTGWEKINNVWYYFTGSGAMKKGWLLDGGSWYYLNANGSMKTGWLYTGGQWYYLTSSGAMKTGWLKLGTTWYYLSTSGAMKTGWQLVGKNWYYFYSSGAMAYNTTIGGYKLGASGAWIK
jgi:hypothetical protein